MIRLGHSKARAMARGILGLGLETSQVHRPKHS